MATKYQPLVDHIATRAENAVTLSFAEIEAIVGSPLSMSLQIDASLWTDAAAAIVWRLHALGWSARLGRHNRCVVFARNQEQ